jgi:hypothetical protein
MRLPTHVTRHPVPDDSRERTALTGNPARKRGMAWGH